MFYYFSAKKRISDNVFTRASISTKARFSIKPDILHYVKYYLRVETVYLKIPVTESLLLFIPHTQTMRVSIYVLRFLIQLEQIYQINNHCPVFSFLHG
jgi:hypothetical protein